MLVSVLSLPALQNFREAEIDIVSQSVMSDSATPWTVAGQAPLSVHGILQARILEWVAIFFSRGSPQPRDQTPVSCTGKQIL